MQIKIIGNNVDIGQIHHQLVFEHLEKKLEKYLAIFNSDIAFADVRIEKDSRWGYTVNFSMSLPGKTQIFAQTRDKTLPTSIRKLRHLVERQLKDYRRKIGINQKGSQTAPGKLEQFSQNPNPITD